MKLINKILWLLFALLLLSEIISAQYELSNKRVILITTDFDIRNADGLRFLSYKNYTPGDSIILNQSYYNNLTGIYKTNGWQNQTYSYWLFNNNYWQMPNYNDIRSICFWFRLEDTTKSTNVLIYANDNNQVFIRNDSLIVKGFNIVFLDKGLQTNIVPNIWYYIGITSSIPILPVYFGFNGVNYFNGFMNYYLESFSIYSNLYFERIKKRTDFTTYYLGSLPYLLE